MPEPSKLEPKKAKKPENPRLAAARERAENIAKGPSGAPKPPSQFFKETWRELKLTTWPDRTTTEKSTLVVLAFILAAAGFLGTFDYLLTKVTALLSPQ
jgi:preprotein translocase SecE subunit